MYKIIRTTPGSIFVQSGSQVAKISGESFLRGYGSPDFVIDASSVRFWEDGDNLNSIDEGEKVVLIDFVLKELRGRDWDIVSE